MASKKGRQVSTWFGTPLSRLGLALCAFIQVKHRLEGLRGGALKTANCRLFRYLLPQFPPRTDDSIHGRCFTLNLQSKIGENPGLQPRLAKYVSLAMMLLERGEPLPVEELAHELASLDAPMTIRAERRTFNDGEVKEAADRQNWKCRHCGAELNEDNPPVGDHMLPWSLGGPTNAANCDAVCVPCNQGKGRLHPVEWGRKLDRMRRGGRTSLVRNQRDKENTIPRVSKAMGRSGP